MADNRKFFTVQNRAKFLSHFIFVVIFLLLLFGEAAVANPQDAGRRPSRIRNNVPANTPAGRGPAGASAATPDRPAAAQRIAPPVNNGANADSGNWSEVGDAKSLDVNIEYKKPKRGTKFAFNLVDADLIELVKIIGNISGKSFIIGGTVPKIKATIYAPAQITAAEAYTTFLSILQVNGLTVIPSGRYLKIVQVANLVGQKTPIMQNVPDNDQVITRLQPVSNVDAEDLASLLGRFKSPDGDITVYAPTNTLIITDYGSSIRRLVRLITLLDVTGSKEQIWVEPVNYASADEIAAKIEEIFDSGSTKSAPAAAPAKRRRGKNQPAAAAPAPASADSASTVNYSKIIADERTNSLIIVASEEGYLRILELVKILDVSVDGEGTLHVRKLQHASADELAKTLSIITKTKNSTAKGNKGAAATNLFEGEIQISADKATNSLVIVSSLRDYISLNAVIDDLDSMQRQVFVEAVIMEVALSKDREIGVGLHGGGLAGSGDNKSLIYGLSYLPGGPNSFSMDPSALTGLAAGLSGPEIPGSEDLVGFSIPAFGVAIQALQKNTDVNVLSAPNILATDNEEASISVGENVPVLSGINSGAALMSSLMGSQALSSSGVSAGSLNSLTSSYKRQDVGITLKITPHINDDNQVRLEVDLEISEVKSVDESGPTISKQNAKTTSVVADQQTFVLGGLITDNEVETTTKVPVLGDIPLIGMLFRHKGTTIKKRNLVIFLTPYIIRNADDFRDIFQRKMAERREFIERYTAFEYHRYDPHLEWARTKGALSVINDVIGKEQNDFEMRSMMADEKVDSHTPKKPLGFSGKGKKRVRGEGAAEEGDGGTPDDGGDIVIEAGSQPDDQPADVPESGGESD
ncbi:MAG: type II secretion system secretin GspD [Deltaproteobacteria bacterium]|nr:type II secretion system secretin GspD [Deltaproteobacteria bacterium]